MLKEETQVQSSSATADDHLMQLLQPYVSVEQLSPLTTIRTSLGTSLEDCLVHDGSQLVDILAGDAEVFDAFAPVLRPFVLQKYKTDLYNATDSAFVHPQRSFFLSCAKRVKLVGFRNLTVREGESEK